MRFQIDREQVSAALLLGGIAAMTTGLPVVREIGIVTSLGILLEKPIKTLEPRVARTLMRLFSPRRTII